MTIFAAAALLDDWAGNVRVRLGADGRIAGVDANADPAPGDERVDVLLPAPGNLHSHAFQRAMAGLSEYRSASEDSFWTWRDLMYRFARALTPEDVEAIAAFAFMEMAEAGYGAVAEFHYLHHAPDGASYDNVAEMSARIIAAAQSSGLGLTLLPVYYAYGGAGLKPLGEAQQRFASTRDSYERLVAAIAPDGADAVVGAAFHSLRAIAPDDIAPIAALRADAPIHIHIAEQTKEVEDVKAWLGARPVEWVLANAPVDSRWCFVHATHMMADETRALAASGAVAGICPVTEANLGDGVFPGADYLAAGGAFGVGTDSNVEISLAGELSLFEYSQRLARRRRNVMCAPPKSTARTLFDGVCKGGARALGRDSGRIAAGALADLVAFERARAPGVFERDAILDAFVFAGARKMISDVWSGGRRIVRDGRHLRRSEFEAAYQKTARRLNSL